jgi:uncharacterized protein YndB with AHSA1/START domain
MAPIVHTIEIARSPEDVFAYISDLGRHHEWQDQIVSTKVKTDGPTRLGTRATDTRKVPGGEREITYEITAFDPPRRTEFTGVDGPVRPLGKVTVEPVGDGSSSKLTIELDFEGHGIRGKVLLPLVRREAAKEVPNGHAKLKERLESGT